MTDAGGAIRDGPDPRNGWLEWGAFTAVVLIWGSTFLAIRVSNDAGYDPFSAALARVLLAGVLLTLLTHVGGLTWPTGRDLAFTIFAGSLMLGVNFALLYYGEVTVPSGMAAVLWAVFPILVALGAHVLLPTTEPLRWPIVAGALLALGGLVVLFWDSVRTGGPVRGIVAILGGILAAAVAQVTSKRWGGGIHPIPFIAVGSWAAAVLLLPLAFLFGQGLRVPPTPGAWLALLYLGAVASMGAFVVYFWLLQRWPATRLSFQTVLSPLIAVVLGAVFLDEVLGMRFVVGTALTVLGTAVAIEVRPLRRRPAQP